MSMYFVSCKAPYKLEPSCLAQTLAGSAGRRFCSQTTSDGCPDFPVHSFISPNVEEATLGTVILDSILTDEGEWVGGVE